ncbi:hypothetical protein J6590_072840 [Homalodisca vitripennis]|nr:hypothetical protein J6590_072840 [Homalodisca vitripennis]
MEMSRFSRWCPSEICPRNCSGGSTSECLIRPGPFTLSAVVSTQPIMYITALSRDFTDLETSSPPSMTFSAELNTLSAVGPISGHRRRLAKGQAGCTTVGTYSQCELSSCREYKHTATAWYRCSRVALVLLNTFK